MNSVSFLVLCGALLPTLLAARIWWLVARWGDES